MRLKLFTLSLFASLVAACQQAPVALGGPDGIYQNQPTLQERIITQRDGDASQNRFAGFGNNIFSQAQPAPSNIQQRSFNFFGGLSSGEKTKIAFLVPLSGKFKSLGESMLNSAQLALFFLNDPNLVLMPIDTKGTPFGAKQAAEEAIAREAKMILGPVFSRSASAVIAVTEGSDINVISFSNDKSLAGTGVFAIGFRPEQEIHRIVTYALENGVLDYTAVLPNNNYGATAAESLRLAINQTDASLLRSEIYYIDQRGAAKNLYRHTLSALNAALTNRAERDYLEEEKRYTNQPIKYPRGMLVPEGGARLKEIIENLEKTKRFDREKVRLLGSALWSDELPQDPVLEGAWFAAADANKHQAFQAHYRQVYGKEPPAIASLAYDGVALAVALSRMSGGRDFSREAITNARGFVGVDGIFRLEQDGLTTRGLAIMEIQNGQPVIVDPAPRSFSELEQRRARAWEQIGHLQAMREEARAIEKSMREQKAQEQGLGQEVVPDQAL